MIMINNKFWFVFIVFSVVILSFAFKDSSDCAKIKNGRFYYYLKRSRERVDIERFDSLQVETNTKNGNILKNKIVWKEDCKFEMYVNAFSDSKLTGLDSLLAATPSTVEITDLYPQYYVCKYKVTILNRNIEGTDTMYFRNDD